MYLEGSCVSRSAGPCGAVPAGGRGWGEQLLIGLDGKLLRPNESVPPVGASRACSSCVRTADVKEVCAQCDRFVCQSCRRLCSGCSTVTCSLCSTADYGDVGEQVLCNGCSIFQV
ncbi:PREDICTED: apoptosis regulatory protein Siva [Acanthisitta chloris]|uniref:apoptosis regulatory protein Siva n=1 Tax=Acanthisitta chloris TaxID=57068 RepID=UPI0004F0DF98|nr:PREDICTED: apoptosis regulatory protein Siva [Acanthisitta chloris]